MSGCALPQFEDGSALSPTVTLTVVDEHGDRVAGARVAYGARSATTDRQGNVEIDLTRPVVAVISDPDFLDEPVAVDPNDSALEIRLWSRNGDDGRVRTSIHFGGDVMLGRRYLEPDRPTPFVDDEASARRVVAELGPMSASADHTIVNLESVIGELDDDLSLPAKRFLIQSTPLITAALDELGVDLVTLGNNHAYDWGPAGLTATLDTLDAAGIAHAGAGSTTSDAVRGRLLGTDGVATGIISVTSVTGDYVNDRLPSADEPMPRDLPPDEMWQYERRPFGLRAPTDSDTPLADLQVAPRGIRIVEAWAIVQAAETYLSSDDAAVVWELVRSVFPELQDWVARRGHGGAAPYDAEAVAREIQRLERAGADFVVVQIHGGYQFAPVASEFIRTASRAAIDAGADAVVSHHPHVLQGVEWYGDGLIVHSLGNLLFDQDFHATFPSTLLRVVTDGEDMLEARLLPLVLDRYRPTPLTGDAARRVVGAIMARSELAATSTRVDGRVISAIDASPVDDDTTIRFQRNSGLIDRGAAETIMLQVRSGEDAALPPCSLVRADLLTPGVEVADELFGWGDFDRTSTGARRTFPVGWLVPLSHDRWTIDEADGSRELGEQAIRLTSSPEINTTLRIAALVDVPPHRLHDASGRPVDAVATHEVRLMARRNRGEAPFIRFASYARHDTDPTVEPETIALAEVEVPLDLPDDEQWHELVVDVPEWLMRSDGDGGLALNVTLVVPPAHLGTVEFDDIELLEWRGRADTDQAVWVPASRVRSDDDAADISMQTC